MSNIKYIDPPASPAQEINDVLFVADILLRRYVLRPNAYRHEAAAMLLGINADIRDLVALMTPPPTTREQASA